MNAAAEGPYLLREDLASKRKGEPVFFKTWTGIGPAATLDLNEAERFDSWRAAINSPALDHPLSFYVPILEATALEELAVLYGVTAEEMRRHLAKEAA